MPLATSYPGLNKIQNKRGKQLGRSFIMKQSWTDSLAIVTNGISVSHAGAAAAGTTNMTLGGSLTTGGVGVLDYARNVVITVTHGSAVVAMSGTITGTDIHGRIQTEAWAVTAGTTSKTFTGVRTFKTVTSITETIAATAAANTIIAGTGKVFGLEANLSVASGIKEVSGGSVVTTGTLVVSSTASTADPRGTYSPAASPDGSTDFVLYYLSDNPESS